MHSQCISFDLDFVLEQRDKIFKSICEDKESYEYLVVDKLLLYFLLESANVESLLFADKIKLIENCRHYSESNIGNETIFTCGGYGVATISAENVFLFDSHSRNTDGLHNLNERNLLLSFSLLAL